MGRVGWGVVPFAVVGVLLLSGCAEEDDKRGTGDAPVANQRGDDTPAQVFNMPDGFGNLATKCVGHGFRAYVTTNASGPSNVQIVPDGTCAG
ncbi:hypothetical protein OG948_40545 (plasmid) [Embleya sp. NBC_00888]|uniref:hypothetical protein n=1 Tax=Embleya sp. NBC_00888 TaxID=2975960 RepID=UPI0038663DD0|nr:hypothetical protein OG948_40545 [Embleya sp. NBC_00888]